MILKSPEERGFTLIELLVVIAIIGLLSSIILASLNTARAKGRDAQRISNVQSLKLAMELYYDANNTYPKNGTQDAGYYVSDLGTFLAPGYLPSIPTDPQGQLDQYVWGPGGASYGLYIYTERLGWCRTGVNVNPGWWGVLPTCNF